MSDEDRVDQYSWLREDYLSKLMAYPRHAWVAHYENTGGGKDMNTLVEMLKRADPCTGFSKHWNKSVGADGRLVPET